MKIILKFFIATAILLTASVINVSAQLAGETEFKQICAACHSIGKGKLVGPDLVNLSQRRPEDWIVKFIKSSQAVVKGGDKYADSLFQAFNQTVMPDQPTLTDEKIKNIIAYIGAESSVPTITSPALTSDQTNKQIGKATDSFFTTTNIFLLTVIFIMLLLIVFLLRVNKGLVEQLTDYYSSNKSFFK
ncbi:MAG: cytochrome c [Saprospiraceae bacterium]